MISDRVLIQKAMNKFIEWSKCWQLEVAPLKLAVLSLNSITTPKYSLNLSNLPECMYHKDLGIRLEL